HDAPVTRAPRVGIDDLCRAGHDAAHEGPTVVVPAGGRNWPPTPGGRWKSVRAWGPQATARLPWESAVLPRARLSQSPCTLASPKARKSRDPFHQWSLKRTGFPGHLWRKEYCFLTT